MTWQMKLNEALLNLEKFKNNFKKRENLFFIILIIVIFFIDRVTKNKILTDYGVNIHFINNYLNIDLIWNTGIGFGIFSASSILAYSFISFIIGSVILILVYYMIISQIFDKLIYSLIIGGALGNFYDRLIFNAVPDFIDLHYNEFHWFTFNFADIVISLGVILFFAKNFCEKN